MPDVVELSAGRPRSASAARLPWRALAAGAALALLGMGEFAHHASTDSLLPSLMSTQRLTFYYWGQDRLANLLPLLAFPVRDVLANFYVQTFAMAGGFFALLLQLGWFHLHASGRTWNDRRLAAVILITGLLTVATYRQQNGLRFLIEQQYGLTCALYLLGLRLFVGDRPLHRTGGAVLVVVATVVNPSWLLLAPAAWLLRDEERLRVRRTLEALGLAVGAFALSSVAAAALGQGEALGPSYNSFSVSLAADGLSRVLELLRSSVRASWAAVLLLLAVAVLAARWRRLPPRLRYAQVGAVAFAAAWTVTFSGNAWVEQNSYSPRYFFPVYAAAMFLLVGGVAEVVLLIGDRMPDARSSRRAPAGIVLGAVILAVASTGIRDIARRPVPDAMSAQRPIVEELARQDVRLVIGDYSKVWPTVLLARHEGLDVLGAAYRADPLGAEILDLGSRSGEEGVSAVCIGGFDDERCLRQLWRTTGRHWEIVGSDVRWVMRVRPA